MVIVGVLGREAPLLFQNDEACLGGLFEMVMGVVTLVGREPKPPKL